MLSSKNRSLKISPDCSGYAILQLGLCAFAIAFERKAGRVFPQNSTVPLLKKSILPERDSRFLYIIMQPIFPAKFFHFPYRIVF